MNRLLQEQLFSSGSRPQICESLHLGSLSKLSSKSTLFRWSTDPILYFYLKNLLRRYSLNNELISKLSNSSRMQFWEACRLWTIHTKILYVWKQKKHLVPQICFIDLESNFSAARHVCLYSSVAEHWSRKPGVVSSTLTGGIFLFVTITYHLNAYLLIMGRLWGMSASQFFC